MPGSQTSSSTRSKRLRPQRFEARLTAGGGFGGEAFVLEHAGERFADAGLVVNNQNARLFHAVVSTSAIAAISTTKRAPIGTFSSTRICAP